MRFRAQLLLLAALSFALVLGHRLFLAVALPILAAAILWGLLLMPIKGTSLAVRLDVGLAWLAALSILLVPTDVANALQVDRSTSDTEELQAQV